METVQLTITDQPYAAALRELLMRSGMQSVCCVEVADPRQDGVIVVDSEGLDRLPAPVYKPERIVLITRNDSEHLMRAWNAGIRSVVFNEDPLSTAVLAIMAAELRVPKSDTRCGVSQGGSATRCTDSCAAGDGVAHGTTASRVRAIRPKKEGLK
jgi:hypothetical protein